MIKLVQKKIQSILSIIKQCPGKKTNVINVIYFINTLFFVSYKILLNKKFCYKNSFLIEI